MERRTPWVLAVDAGSEIEIGDLVYLEVDDVRPASTQADQSSLAANQELFHDKFVGVAMQQSPAGATDSIRVATSGVFSCDCATATYEVGDLVGINEDGTGTELEDQVVIGVATENLAVGRCVKRATSSDSSILVDIVSTVVRGGPQTAA